MVELNAKIPAGPIAEKWDTYKSDMKLVNPNNKRKFKVIVVGSGLAGASAAATLSELGYRVSCFCFQDSPRRAHSIAAQGGINAAKNYQNDGDSVYRLFYDTIKGGDFRAREANVHRLAEVSVNIIDQCVAQGVPFAREYGGLLDNRSFGGAQVSRTFYARGQTGQQLLIGAYQSLMRQVHEKSVKLFSRREMLDVVLIDGKARGIIVRNLTTGEIAYVNSGHPAPALYARGAPKPRQLAGRNRTAEACHRVDHDIAQHQRRGVHGVGVGQQEQRHAVRLLVAQRGQHALHRVHGCCSIQVSTMRMASAVIWTSFLSKSAPLSTVSTRFSQS